MQQHVQIGEDLVEQIVSDIGLENDPAAAVMRHVVAGHHERGDGSGYPRGLKFPDIPVASCIVAVADVYDALSSSRPYKAPWTEPQCEAELRTLVARGLLEPHCVEALLKDPEGRQTIKQRYPD